MTHVVGVAFCQEKNSDEASVTEENYIAESRSFAKAHPVPGEAIGDRCSVAEQYPTEMVCAHPLDPLTAEEISAAAACLRAYGDVSKTLRFNSISLKVTEPHLNLVWECATLHDYDTQRVFEARILATVRFQ